MKKLIFCISLVFFLSLIQVANAEEPPELDEKILREILSLYFKGGKKPNYLGLLGIQRLGDTYRITYFLDHDGRYYKADCIYLENDKYSKYN